MEFIRPQNFEGDKLLHMQAISVIIPRVVIGIQKEYFCKSDTYYIKRKYLEWAQNKLKTRAITKTQRPVIRFPM